MRIATFEYLGRSLLGVVAEAGLIDVTSACPSMLQFVSGGPDMLGRVGDTASSSTSQVYDLDDVRLRAPFPVPPRNILCVGRNYAAHIAEGARDTDKDIDLPATPTWFTKAVTSICGPYDELHLDGAISNRYDWEGELALVIGRAGRKISTGSAMGYVHSYCVMNDVTARDVQHGYADQWFKGKSIDHTSPIGPWLVTADEIPDPTRLQVTCRVNGVVKQSAKVSEMIFDIPTLIADISEALTLAPGDVVSTGTPEGVGNGRRPRETLKPGDVLETEVDGIGCLRNECVAV